MHGQQNIKLNNVRSVAIVLLCSADPGGRAVSSVGLRPLACWDCGFESLQGNGYLSTGNAVFCQVEIFASG